MTMMTFCYGPSASQEGDLYLPGSSKPAVVCLLHGGFWRMPHGRDQFATVAQDLAAQGYAVWNVGYRRIGERGGGWPGTLEDVASAIDHLASISDTVVPLDLHKVVVAGHSAGGHLALCAAGDRRGAADAGLAPRRVRPLAVAGLAAMTDLQDAFARNLGNGAVNEWFGGAIEPGDDNFALASPLRRLPLRVPQLILHGTDDATVPIDTARRYARAAREAGDPLQYVELPGSGHMEYLDAASDAHRALSRWLGAILDIAKGEVPTVAS